MTAAPATSTALPPGVVIPHNENTNNQGNQAPIPVPQPDWPAIPKLLLSIEDMACPGAVRFMNLQDSPAFLQSCVVTIFELLFTSKSAPRNVRSIKLILRPMDGVAYTTGSRLDNDHKEIHFNTNYIAAISPERIVSEIKGVILHELVHCFQCSGQGCPGGLIEGMAGTHAKFYDGIMNLLSSYVNRLCPSPWRICSTALETIVGWQMGFRL
ncbi:hypothetical protein FRC16_008208 [Serendipita sp. 398]|nr:hypothetical protein FRC16_008208 [Serendipita sp. 398]